jgi:hypothetical protein
MNHDLKYFEVGWIFIFYVFLHISWIHFELERTITKCNHQYNHWWFVENHQYIVILSYSKQVLDKYLFNIPTCTLLASSSRMCRLFLKLFFQYKISWLCGSMCFQNVHDFFFIKMKVIHESIYYESIYPHDIKIYTKYIYILS